MRDLCLLVAGGAAGAVARYLVSGAVHRLWTSSFPLGTTVVNLTGCLLAGLLLGSPAPSMLGLGVLGGFTTFSTWTVESLQQLRGAAPTSAAVLNLVLVPLAGAFLVSAGMMMSKGV